MKIGEIPENAGRNNTTLFCLGNFVKFSAEKIKILFLYPKEYKWQKLKVVFLLK